MSRDDREKRAVVKQRMRGLSRRLDPWDPFGVYAYDDQPEPGEYDCLVGPTMRKLHDGASPVEIADMIAHELVEHFGLPESAPPLALATELRTWWDEKA